MEILSDVVNYLLSLGAAIFVPIILSLIHIYMHKERIRISDAILVVDIDHYIGSSTQGEIEFARALGKEIIYYTDIVGTME